MHVLVVEDDEAFGAALARGLAAHDVRVTRVRDAGSGLRRATDTEFDAHVVDWMLPDHDGPWLVARLRELGISGPVLMLTARDTVTDRVAGLDAGADDYLVKPFHLDELLARLRAQLRRTASAPPRRLGIGPLVLDADARRVTLDGRPVHLTPGESALLECLLRHLPGAATRSALGAAITELDGAGTAGSIETHLSRLRGKLRGGGVHIRTLRGLGYLLEPDRSDVRRAAPRARP